MKAQLQHYVASRRIGKNGLRPFGSRASTSVKKKSQGARMRTKQSLSQQPLLGVLQTIRKWFLKERKYGHEVRSTTLMTRLRLELETEIGKQNVLQQQGSAHFNEHVLRACQSRLGRITDPRLATDKAQWSWNRRSYRGDRQEGQQAESHTDSKTEQLLWKLTWPAWWKTQPPGKLFTASFSFSTNRHHGSSGAQL